MQEVITFPKGLNGVFHIHERIIELYQFNDLLEIIPLNSSEDEWNEVLINGQIWDLNLWFDDDSGEYKLFIYPVETNASGGNSTNTYYYEPIDIKIEK